MFKLYKYDGHYIQGELLSSHTSESAALKKAKKEIKYLNAVKEESKDEIVIWLDGESGQPLGVITKKKRKRMMNSNSILLIS